MMELWTKVCNAHKMVRPTLNLVVVSYLTDFVLPILMAVKEHNTVSGGG